MQFLKLACKSDHHKYTERILFILNPKMNGFPTWCSGKESAGQCRRHKGILPNEEEDEECSEEVVKSSLWGSSSGSVFIFGQISLSFSHIRPVLGHSGKMHVHLFAKIDSSFVGCLASSVMRWCHLLFEHCGVFLCLCRFLDLLTSEVVTFLL